VPRWLKGDFHRLTVPELPQRTVGWASHRRHVLAAPVRAVHELMLGMVSRLGARQPGVHVGCNRAEPAPDAASPFRNVT